MEHIKPSPTLAVDAKAKALKAQGVDVIGFGAGEPDFDTPEHIKQAAVQAIKDGFTKYTPAGGTEELKAAVCAKFTRDNNLAYGPAEILISCGAKHSLYNIFQALLDPGDEVIIPAPYWVSYPDMVYLAGGVPVVVGSDERSGFKITPDRLAAAISPRTKVFVLNSPSNPTGAAYTREELRALADVLAKTSVIVVSDEIYEKIVYDGAVAHSIVSVAPELRDRAIIVNGVSKTYSMTGWRIGYAAGPRQVIAAMTNIQSQSTSNPTSIAQKAARAALNGPQECIADMTAEFDRRRKYMVDRLNAIPGITCSMPAGAFYTFPNIAALYGKKSGQHTITGADAFAAYLLDTVNVAVVSGTGFGAASNMRLSYATSFEIIAAGLDRIAQAVAALA